LKNKTIKRKVNIKYIKHGLIENLIL
jgi:hypothetical protein